MSPTFQALFNRSAYSPGASQDEMDEIGQERQKQVERYSAAMIAFAFQHDRTFREHFLARICSDGTAERLPTDGWIVKIEPDDWGDLVLKIAPNFAVVLELKIRAELKPHQDPSKPEFLRKDGYGYAILNEFGDFVNVRYITLLDPKWNRIWNPTGDSHKLRCFPRRWVDLLRRPGENESTIEANVYDCLDNFGVSVFSSRKLANMKLGNYATEVLNILLTTFDNQGGNYQKSYFVGDRRCIGLSIPKDEFPTIAKLVGTDDEIVGWFGYDNDDENQAPRLSVWLYSRKASDPKRALERIKERIKDGDPNGELKIKSEDRNLVVFCLASESTGDKEWFEKVFKIVNSQF